MSRLIAVCKSLIGSVGGKTVANDPLTWSDGIAITWSDGTNITWSE